MNDPRAVMLAEVKGLNFSNLGSTLMLRAIQARLGAQMDFATTARNDYGDRAHFGTRQLLRETPIIPLQPLVPLVPGKLRQRLGLVRDSEVGVTLDASGFAYGDSWGPEKARIRLSAALRRRARLGTPIVLLPQAFGPFEGRAMRDAFAPILEGVDLMFVRDRGSLRWLESAFGALPEHVHTAPDMTIGLPALRDERHARLRGRPVIVPNHMVVKGGNIDREQSYVNLLAAAVSFLRQRDLNPFIAVHDTLQDPPLAKRVAATVGGELELVSEPRPEVMKGILGDADVVIGSRFHALVSALSQGRPVLAIGWSHKYEELLDDFDCPDMLLDAMATPGAMNEKLGWLMTHHRELEAAIARKQRELYAGVDVMWTRVESQLAPVLTKG